MKDIVKERINLGVCPICNEITIETKIVDDPKYGSIKICKKHPSPKE